MLFHKTLNVNKGYIPALFLADVPMTIMCIGNGIFNCGGKSCLVDDVMLAWGAIQRARSGSKVGGSTMTNCPNP